MCSLWSLGFLCIFMLHFPCYGLDNGLALTPPMGWLSWTRFLCEIDCNKFPQDCISEKLFTKMADIMVNEGFREAGYEHVNLDDCWMTKTRSKEGKLLADPQRFPHGIKWLAEYMHTRGLKFGIYENYGKRTCMGFAGSQDFMQIDAATFVEWDVDMLKFDGCFNDPKTLDKAFPEMGRYLNESGRKIIYSCSWPFYVRKELRMKPDYEQIMSHCNLWRNFDDIQIHWKSIEAIINFYDEHQEQLSSFHGPGHWNDPDMIIIGNPGLTPDQCRAQMALWAIWSAPLLMSNDLRDIAPEFKAILLNRRVIAINQDPLGVMGKKIKQLEDGKISIYLKPISSKYAQAELRSYAIVFLNRDEYRMLSIRISLESLDLPFHGGYVVEDLFYGASPNSDSVVHRSVDELIELKVPPTGVIMWRVDPAIGDVQETSETGPLPKKIQDGLTFGQRYYDVIFGQFWFFYALMVVAFVYFCFKRLRISRCKRSFRIF